MNDIWTIIWKEWKELLVRRGSMRGGTAGLLVMIAVLGIVPPMQAGAAWADSVVPLAFSAWIAAFLVASIVTDSFAGERERHTLETLLASRLTDRAILFGKICAAVSYGWGLTLLIMLIAIITVNVGIDLPELLFYTPFAGIGIVSLSLFASLLMAGVGILISLRASSARQAQQTMSIALMVLLFVPIFGIQALPATWKQWILARMSTLDPGTTLVVFLVFLIVTDLGLLAIVISRFRRSRLVFV